MNRVTRFDRVSETNSFPRISRIGARGKVIISIPLTGAALRVVRAGVVESKSYPTVAGVNHGALQIVPCTCVIPRRLPMPLTARVTTVPVAVSITYELSEFEVQYTFFETEE